MSGAYDYSPMFTFTAASNDYFTVVNHWFKGGETLQVRTTGVLPNGLVADTVYYVLATGLLVGGFYVSLTPGGAPVNINDGGTGTHYFSTLVNSRQVASVALPDSTIKAGRQENGVGAYKEPPPANKLELGYAYDHVVGTLSGGGGESWG